MPARFVALLRGINVGGNNPIAMADLRELFGSLGYGNPRTILQSGNVVFESNDPPLMSAMESAIEERFGHRVTVIIRAEIEWVEMMAANPFEEMAHRDPSHLVVIFLAEEPQNRIVSEVSDAISGPERIAAFKNNLFVCYPEGIGTSRLSRTRGWNELAALGTGRNWNTIRKLGEMLLNR